MSSAEPSAEPAAGAAATAGAAAKPPRGMRLRLLAHQVPGPGRLRRVLTPRRPLDSTWIVSPVSASAGHGFLAASRGDLLRIGALLRLAGTSPHSAVHIPCGQNQPVPEVSWFYHQGCTPLDLLLLRRDTGLRPSDWRAVRSRTVRGRHPGRPLTVRTPAARPPAPWREWEWPRTELIQLTEQSGTLILSGPPRALLEAGDEVTWAGEAVARDRDIHRHGFTHLTDISALLRDGGSNADELELNIASRDPHFHRARRQKEHNRHAAEPARRRSDTHRVPARRPDRLRKDHLGPNP
jgi:hypothetical protein